MKAEVLVGMIASGKSTYAKQRAKEGAVVINDDSIVEAIHAGDYTLYNKKLKPLYKTIENTIFSMAVALDKDIIIDRGVNNCKQSRSRWTALASCLDIEIEAVEFPREHYSDNHAKRRFDSDARGLSLQQWKNIAKHHAEHYETPILLEGFKKIKLVEFREGKVHIIEEYNAKI